MLQNYKIHHKNRVIWLITEKDFNIHSQDEVIQYSSEIQLAEIIEDETTKDVKIYSHNLNRLFTAFSSLFTLIEAAGGVVINEKKEILLIHRMGKWDLPKGKVEVGEKIIEAAVREVEEETSISIESVLGELPSTYHTYPHNGKIILKRVYWFLMEGNSESELKPQQEEEITDVGWYEKEQLIERVKDSYGSIQDTLSVALSELI